MKREFVNPHGPCLCGSSNLSYLDEVGTHSNRKGFLYFYLCEDCHRMYRAQDPEYGDEDDCKEYHYWELVESATVPSEDIIP